MTTNPHYDIGDLDRIDIAADIETIASKSATYGFIFRAILPIIKEHQKRIKALEERPAGMKWCGVWNEHHAHSVGYERDEAVTVKGSLWVCKGTGVTEKPGTTHSWQLAVKEGHVNSSGQRGQR